MADWMRCLSSQKLFFNVLYLLQCSWGKKTSSNTTKSVEKSFWLERHRIQSAIIMLAD